MSKLSEINLLLFISINWYATIPEQSYFCRGCF